MEETDDIRIGRYLSGEMTDSEQAIFIEEMTSNAALMEQVEVSRLLWAYKLSDTSESWDVEAALARFTYANAIPTTKVVKLSSRRFYWGVAAGLIIMIGLYSLFMRDGSPETYTWQEDSNAPVELKDGSRIFLNKNATLKVYPFKKKKRHIELAGEAYMEITHDPKRPFTVASGNTLTEVVGTSFNIRQTNTGTQIFVSSGKVIFTVKNDDTLALALTKGEAATYENKKLSLIPNPSPNINAWYTRELRFAKMPLEDIVADITAYFGKEVIIEHEASKSCIINIPLAFKKPEIKSILDAVAATINASLSTEGETYVIKGGRACK